MTAKLFSLRRGDGQPSTQFAATIVGMPEVPFPLGVGADAPNPDTLSPDSLVTDGSGANHAVPDVVTDIGGLPSEVPDPADAPTLSHIGRYALKRQLGSGGLGAVFEAWDPLLSRAVAVKTLQFDTELSSRTSLDGLFLNEARAAAGLNHRYIVTIHDAGLSPHGVYIAMERLYGRDLQHALADGWRPTLEQAVQLVRRVTEALAYAHARGVVHCDIKPANIFLQRRDRPKVLDFGIARIVHGGALPALDGAVVGSPRYRAPEQLTGAPVDARTDLFSLGAVMFELLCGRRAFEGDTLAQINASVLAGAPKPVHEIDPRVPVELSAIVSRLLAPVASDRYTCATELSVDLRRWMVGQQARRHGQAGPAAGAPVTVVSAPGAASPRALLAGGVILAAAALAMGWWGMPSPATQAAPGAAALPPAAPATAASAAADGLAPATSSRESSSSLALPADPAAASVSEPAPATRDVPSAAAPAAAPAAALSARPAALAAPAPPTPLATPSRNRAALEAPQRVRSLPAADAAPRDTRSTDAPVPATVSTGVVQFAVSPWGEVHVNGVPYGTTPPLSRLTLPEGTHTITLHNADFAPHSVQVQVSTDKPFTLRHRFGA